ncbi:MAG: sugar phosphate isomerase/epimerase family protein [Spirochaetota bacterium]
MKPIALFSKHLGWLTIDQLGPVAAELGLTAVELTVRPGGHVEPARAKTDLPRAIRTLRLSGISVPSGVTSITRPSDPETPALLAAIAAQGIPRYRMGWFSLPEVSGGKPTSDPPALRAALDAAKSALEGLVRLNEQFGLQGCYENHAGARFAGASPWSLWELVRDLPARHLGVEFDLRHAVVEGWSSWEPAYRLLSDRIGAVLVKDFTWEVRHTESGALAALHPQDVPLGEGVAPFPRLFELLRGDGYEGPVVLHAEYPVSPDDDPKRTPRQLEGRPGSVPGAPRDAFTRAAADALRRDLDRLREWIGAVE